MEDLFRSYWWLIFPIFGMGMAFWGMVQDDRRARSAMDLIKSYIDRGQEPPPELMQLAIKESDEFGLTTGAGGGGRNSNAWTFVTFLALAVGFGVGYWWVRDEGYAYAFLIVAVTMGVLALGALAILLFGRK